MRFVFADGEKICLYDDGKVTEYPSKFIEKYKENALNAERAKSWKRSGEGAQFRGDVRPGEDEVTFKSSVNGIHLSSDENELVYSFTVNGTSGIYKKRLDDEKVDEAHVINSLDMEFLSGCMDAVSDTLVLSVRRNYSNSDIAVFDVKSGDYKFVTEGDTLDEDPYISPDDGNIVYFSSRGVGRDSSGSFVGYSPAAICKLDLGKVDVEEVKCLEKYNLVKPVYHNGKLYAIKTPLKEKGANPLVEIALIPFRIVQAIANFINVFVRAFTGKSLASGGNNPTKARDYDSRKEYVKGNLINVEKELKKNKKRGEDYGFIPLSWQLIEVESGEVIKSGIADYDILSDGTIIATNGRRVFAIKDKTCTKLCNTDCCLKVSCRHESVKKTDLFDF
ncbi:MAG: hypothetical protein HDP34_02795 [Clostridia bacterium]|nr:hypothetical protein [Clostridia bacterium]